MVMQPTYPETALEDVLRQTDVRELALMVKGGLDPRHIVGIYLDPEEAKERAQKVLDGWRGFQTVLSEGPLFARG